MSVSIDVKFSDEALKLIGQLPQLVTFAAIDKSLKEFARPVVQKMLAIAPSSRETGSRRAWSSKYKKNPKWEGIDSGKHVRFRIRKYERGAIVYMGPSHPIGNKQQFNLPKSGIRKHILWGKDTGKTYRVRRRWTQRAYDETATVAMDSFTTSLKRELEKNG